MSQGVDKSGERVQEMFSQIAPRYDFLNHLLSLNIDRWWRRFTVGKLRPALGAPLLDVCTGTGDLALALAKRFTVGPQPCPVVGADFCRPMLELAVSKSQRLPSDQRPLFVEADAQQLPMPSDSFSAVTVAFGLRNVADTRRGLAELVRVCAPGGQVAILEFSQPDWPGLKQLYQGYFRYVLPRLGQGLSRNNQQAYAYLPESVASFPSGQALLEMMGQAGLNQLRHWPLTAGIATLYLGSK